MLAHSKISPENYSLTLIGWANRALNNGENDGVQKNVSFGAQKRKFSPDTFENVFSLPDQTPQFTDAPSARNFLVETMGWTIIDAGATA
jgi:hypothetical protein